MREKNFILVKSAILPLSAFIFSFLSLFCFGATIHVPDDYASIQAAIDASVTSDEIIVTTGTYYENINFNGKDIILRSTNPEDPGVVENTIIDGQKLGSVVMFDGTESGTCVLSGFTITLGKAEYGGGVNGNGSLARIQHNIITNNKTYSEGYGGGIYNCHGLVQFNTISLNQSTFGGGLSRCNGIIQYNTIKSNNCWFYSTAPDGFHYSNYPGYGGGLYDCNGIIQENTIIYNSSEGHGGGIYCSYATIKNNTISENISDGFISYWPSFKGGLGGGIYCRYSIIENNIISGNEAGFGGGLYGYSGMILNNKIFENKSHDLGIYYLSYGGEGGGLYMYDGVIRNNAIFINQADEKGGGLIDSNNIIENNTIWSNIAIGSGGGLYSSKQNIIRNCIIWDNAAPESPQMTNSLTPSYCCIQGWTGGGTGNISTDPKLLVPEYGEFHLQADSPCIDAGCLISELKKDFEGDERGYNGILEPRGDGSDYDIGADEYIGTVPTVTPTPTPCEINVSGDYSTIQAAIDAATDGCTIIVSPGTYNENINFKGKNIILSSTDPDNAAVIAGTVIDGKEAGSVVTFAGKESAFCILEGFTIINGKADYGGGIDANGCLATIKKCVISGNISIIQYGGGGAIRKCNGIIQNNTITGNTAYSDGGGLYNCYGTIQNNIITGNTAHEDGGGLYDCHGMIQNNRISGNIAYSDGGGLDNCWGTIQNNTITSNTALESGGGLNFCGKYIKNCIIWGNSAFLGGDQLQDSSTPSYSCIEDWTGGGTGNISSDPKLLLPEQGDFHLMADSPCIDAGCLISGLVEDFEGDGRGYDGSSEPRGDGSDYDIGADEYNGTVPVSKGVLIYYLLGRLSGISGDLNKDGVIDAADLIWLIKNGE